MMRPDDLRSVEDDLRSIAKKIAGLRAELSPGGTIEAQLESIEESVISLATYLNVVRRLELARHIKGSLVRDKEREG
jgi:hypothetical protein